MLLTLVNNFIKRLYYYYFQYINRLRLHQWLCGKESACKAGEAAEGKGLIPGLGRFPAEGNDNLLQYFLPAKSHGQRSLAGYSPWDCKRIGNDLVTEQSHKQVFLRHRKLRTIF